MFKIGDTVVVIQPNHFSEQKVGKIVRICEHNVYPFYVKFYNNDISSFIGKDNTWFYRKEHLKLYTMEDTKRNLLDE